MAIFMWLLSLLQFLVCGIGAIFAYILRDHINDDEFDDRPVQILVMVFSVLALIGLVHMVGVK